MIQKQNMGGNGLDSSYKANLADFHPFHNYSGRQLLGETKLSLTKPI